GLLAFVMVLLVKERRAAVTAKSKLDVSLRQFPSGSDKGDLAIVGRTYAVADLRFLRFSGFPAWLVWAGVHIYFLIGFANRFFVLVQWALAFLTKRRRVRVLPE